VAELRVKEVDRLAAIAAGLGALGADVRIDGDDLRIGGGRALRGGALNGRGDHRMAMALAVAATVVDGECRVAGSKAVDISYPGFFADLAAVSV
jgi:3-phosphoshikimate 1-carboxyvinyltransferase